jgi:CheY-like chemotaxis protein
MAELRADGTPRATILVVDDNDDVRGLACTMLEALEHRVVEMVDAAAALDHLASADAPGDLLLTDVSMRPLGGLALAERARTLRPWLRVLFMSGEPAAVGAEEVLAKPFTFAALDAAVGRALADRAGGGRS